ncbi:S-adenosyl-L-methionine-dependent methyltransferase [Lichtheimia hyalospora FSU 10163]|nr:S-adenosyl-L-methionine-dependent methyltransferase [Lichtheimia hyalospora FSU 10163]
MPLPSTFRITGTRSHALQIQQLIKQVYVPAMKDVTIDGVKMEAPKPLPWYPEGLGWQVHAPRLVIKRSPEFSKFHKFIVTETEVGNISRQEAVSMIPPLLMDIQPHQWVLDMCAAPGSKTAQIIEAVHANDKLNEMPAGLVIANDADYKRSHLLVHQSKRLQSPCFLATNHDGAYFPNIRLTKGGSPIRFDRVLCDVPCSGDGTMRKNDRIWAEWGQGAALALHNVQVQIFLRGAQLTKVGGRIVYSTCSFNPVENEAVVAEVLRRANGALILKDVSDQLPELKRKPGLTSWKVMTKDGQYLDSLDDIQDEAQRKRFPASLFPPANDENTLHLERCLRIYPHLQDTGGFFVAVFEKVKPMSTAEERMHNTSTPVPQHTIEESDEQQKEQGDLADNTTTVVPSKRSASDSEDPVTKSTSTKSDTPFDLMHPDNAEIVDISNFYGLGPDFPRDQFLIRSEGKDKTKTIYFISSAVRQLLASPEVIRRLNIVMTGVRMFVRRMDGQIDENSAKTTYRLTWEGLTLVDDIINDRRRVTIQSLNELRILLTEAYPKIEQFEPPTIARLEAMELGGCIFDYDAKATIDANQMTAGLNMSLPVWRGRVSLGLLLNKQDKRALCQRIFGVIPEGMPEHLKEKSTANNHQQQQLRATSADALLASDE